MGGNRVSLFLSIALFALLSIGITNASGLAITSNTITTPIDYPQNAVYTINGISGGALPYTFNAYYTNANVPANNVFLGSNTFSPGAYNAIIITINSIVSTSANEISIYAYNGAISAANLLFSNTIITTGTNTIYGAWTFNAFFADFTGANTISSSNTLTINPALSVSILPTSNTLDVGQTLTLQTSVIGGTPGFSIAYTGNDLCGTLSATSNTLSADGTNTIVFTPNTAITSACIANIMASVTDSANTPVIQTATSSLTVNPKLGITSITPAATNTLDEGQPITITATISGGTSPYTYNFIISQYSNPSNIIAFSGPVSNSLTSNSFVWTTNAIGTFVANVIVIDSANVPETANSVYSANIVVNPTPTITLTPSNTVLDSGQTETYTMQISSGTGPFNVELYNVSGSKPVEGNVIISSPGESNTISFIVNSPTSGNIFTYNAIATDTGTSTPYIFSSSSNTITVNPKLLVSISPTSNTLDVGQTLTLQTSVIGGTPGFSIAYTGNDLCGTLSATSNTLSADGTNTIVFTPNTAIASACIANIMASVTDSANTPVIQTATSSLTVNPKLGITSITPAATNTLDEGQPITITATISGGTSPYTYNFIVSNELNPSNIIATNTVSSSSGSESFAWTTSAIGTFVANVIVTDSANVPETTNSVYSAKIVVNPTPAITLKPSNTVLDSGQTETYIMQVSGGTGPFDVELYNITGSKSVNSVIISYGGSNTISFIVNSPTSGTAFEYNAIATDEGTTTPYIFSSSSDKITVNTAPTATLLTPSNTVIDSGQYVTYNVVINGGTLPITANLILVSNSVPIQINGANAVPGTTYNTIDLPSPVGAILRLPPGVHISVAPPPIAFNSLLITTSSSSGGAVAFNVVAVDSASTPVTFNAVANTLTVDAAPYITLTATPSNSIMYGKPFTVNAVITGGTGNFAVYWYLNGNSITPTVVSTNAETSNTIALPAAGNYIYSVSANDIGTSSVYKLTPVTNTIIVAQNNTLTASSSGNPGSSYYSYPVTITFTGTPTIHHQAKWSLYVNGQLYGTTNSVITYYEQFAPPGTYNFVFNLTSDANYTPYTYKTSLVISYPPTGVSGVTTTVTTVTTTSTTTSIPTTSVTTTIPPSQKAISITANISSSSPLVLSLPNTHSVLSIYTTSATSAPIAANIANVTQQVSSFAKPQPNYTLINAVNVSIKTTAPITAFFVEHYPCSIPSDLVAPYIFKNNTWLAITNYTVNATACTVSFSIPSDPIVAIFEKSVPTTTTTSIATTIPTTIPTTIYYPSPSPKPSPIVVEALILIIIVIIIILVLLYYYKLLHRRYHGFKR